MMNGGFWNWRRMVAHWRLIFGWVLVAGQIFRCDIGTKVENRPGELKTTQKPKYQKAK
jgi:hypothetical protein